VETMHSAIIDDNVFVVAVDLLKVSKVCCKMHSYTLRQISLEVSLCKSRILNIFRKYKYHPYKTQCRQQIFALDEESKSETCYEIQERANDRDFLSTICFTDESTFTLNNEPNDQNTRYWAQENPGVNKTQYPQKIHIWAGIFINI
jgi:hypothetical protein